MPHPNPISDRTMRRFAAKHYGRVTILVSLTVINPWDHPAGIALGPVLAVVHLETDRGLLHGLAEGRAAFESE